MYQLWLYLELQGKTKTSDVSKLWRKSMGEGNMSSRKGITVDIYDSIITRLSGKNFFKLVEALIEGPKTIKELGDALEIHEDAVSILLFHLRELDLIRKEDWYADEKTMTAYKRYYLNKTKLRQHIKRIRELARKYSLLLKK